MGLRNAQDLQVSRITLDFPDLPPAFDGYQILHLSDLHVGSVPDGEAILAGILRDLRPDVVAFTGDFQTRGQPDEVQVARQLTDVVAALDPPDGIFAVLGNHDASNLVDPLEALGISVLVNESAPISRGGQLIRLVGLDDVHCFYTPQAEAALAAHKDGFRIALVHTPEVATVAARNGYQLYLSGHTHGGQVCLPGGRALAHALRTHTHLVSGAWAHLGTQGYTSRGSGAGFAPIRFNCPPEVALITLRRA